MKDNNKIWNELKPLVIFLASGVFAKLHKEFMSPSPDFYPPDHFTNKVHHGLHFGIGTCIQVILCLWLLKIVVTEFGKPIFSFFFRKRV